MFGVDPREAESALGADANDVAILEDPSRDANVVDARAASRVEIVEDESSARLELDARVEAADVFVFDLKVGVTTGADAKPGLGNGGDLAHERTLQSDQDCAIWPERGNPTRFCETSPRRLRLYVVRGAGL